MEYIFNKFIKINHFLLIYLHKLGQLHNDLLFWQRINRTYCNSDASHRSVNFTKSIK